MLPPVRALVAAAAFCAVFALACCRGGEPAATVTELPSRARDVRVGDVTLHIVELGPARAPLLVALHGGPGLDHGYLRPWLDPLARHSHLVYADLRGHGRSTTPADANGYSMVAAASDIAALIAVLAPDSATADVVGHDFGAAVALELAARHPERVGRLVLIDPLLGSSQLASVAERSIQTLGPTGWQRVRDLTTPQGTLRDPAQLPALFRALGPMWWHRPPADAVLERMGRAVIYRGEADEHFLAAISEWDGRALAADVRAPALVVSGDDDRTFTPAESRAFADTLPHGHYVEIAAAGHLPFVEQRARFIAAVDGFLAR